MDITEAVLQCSYEIFEKYISQKRIRSRLSPLLYILYILNNIKSKAKYHNNSNIFVKYVIPPYFCISPAIQYDYKVSKYSIAIDDVHFQMKFCEWKNSENQKFLKTSRTIVLMACVLIHF